MKRTSVVLDEDLLKQATEALGHRTYSATINFALKEALRMHRIQSIKQFFGKGLWEGELSGMREDRPPRREKRKAR